MTPSSPLPTIPGPLYSLETPSRATIEHTIQCFLDKLSSEDSKNIPLKHVMILPPDHTRIHSQAGYLTNVVVELLMKMNPEVDISILPALGTHAPMTEVEIKNMFGSKILEFAENKRIRWIVHKWRDDVVTIGEVPKNYVSAATDNYITDKTWPAQLNKYILERQYDLVLSIGQVVPHEVMGMANYNKNLFVGCGGVDAIHLSHFIGAVYGMEKMMGQAENPLRRILHYASDHFLHEKVKSLWYFLTVIDNKDSDNDSNINGLYIGNDISTYHAACEHSLKINFTLLDKSPRKIVVYLHPDEYHSTWLGNKSIYRTRMAIADGGTLIVLAPGVCRFGEDDVVDTLIRKYGYKGTPQIMQWMKEDKDLQNNLSAVAHLIHGSSEGRFGITYCTSNLSKKEIESVGFDFADLNQMLQLYNVKSLKDGWNLVNGEEIYFVRHPGLGLWAHKERFETTR